MPWWGWMVTGVLLLGAEMFGVNAQFYLVFIGAAAIVVGLLGALGLALPSWLQWLCFAALAALCMSVFRGRLYRRYRGSEGSVEERLIIGARVRATEHLAPGASGRVEYRGTTWSARNVGELAIEADSEAEICHTAGLTLHVRKPLAT